MNLLPLRALWKSASDVVRLAPLIVCGTLVPSMGFGQAPTIPSVLNLSIAQETSVPTAEKQEMPLPDVGSLMHEVEAHQRADEAALREYIYRSVETAEESNGHGGVKKRTMRVFDVFWLQGVPVRKMVSKDGKPLNPEDLKKEDDRIDREVAKVKERRKKKDAEGKQTSPRGEEEVTVSRILELGLFTGERREMVKGRDTIVVDYAGDPKAKTRNRMEEVIRDLVGTVWIDEQDKSIMKLQGRFVNAFKIGGGLLVNIRRGTSFAMEQKKINEEVWLPVTIEGQGAARAMLFFNFDGSVRIVDSDFRKFKGSATMLPGVGVVDDAPKP